MIAWLLKAIDASLLSAPGGDKSYPWRTYHWNRVSQLGWYYSDVIMSAMASQITSITIVYSIVYSGADRRKHQISASLAFARGIHRWPVNSPHKGPVTRKMLPFDDGVNVVGWYTETNTKLPTFCRRHFQSKLIFMQDKCCIFSLMIKLFGKFIAKCVIDMPDVFQNINLTFLMLLIVTIPAIFVCILINYMLLAMWLMLKKDGEVFIHANIICDQCPFSIYCLSSYSKVSVGERRHNIYWVLAFINIFMHNAGFAYYVSSEMTLLANSLFILSTLYCRIP